jgi:hypothetical protein
MKIKYTPGTPEGLNGKTYKVEIVAIEILEAKHIDSPLLRQVKIKYENGKTEWISGVKLFDSIDMIQKSVSKRVS